LAFDGNRENRDAPAKFSAKEVFEQLEKMKDVRPGKHPASNKRKRGKDSGPRIFSRKVGLWKLPYWKDLLLPHNLDVMQIEKNICDSILSTLLKLEGKTKDTVNARLDLQDMGIRHHLHLQQHGNTVKMLDAPYVLNKESRIRFCKFLKDVKFPQGVCSQPEQIHKCRWYQGARATENPFLPCTTPKDHTCCLKRVGRERCI